MSIQSCSALFSNHFTYGTTSKSGEYGLSGSTGGRDRHEMIVCTCLVIYAWRRYSLEVLAFAKNYGIITESCDCSIDSLVGALLIPFWLQASISIACPHHHRRNACFRLYRKDAFLPTFHIVKLIEYGSCLCLRQLLGCPLHDGWRDDLLLVLGFLLSIRYQKRRLLTRTTISTPIVL